MYAVLNRPLTAADTECPVVGVGPVAGVGSCRSNDEADTPRSGSPANSVADDGNWRLVAEPPELFCRLLTYDASLPVLAPVTQRQTILTLTVPRQP